MQLPLLISLFAATTLAVPTLVQRVPAPANTNVNPAAITGTTCTDKSTYPPLPSPNPLSNQ
jgi:hypothetical protein